MWQKHPTFILRKSIATFPLLFLLAVLMNLALAQSGEPLRVPTLSIETGMHTAPITRIGVDAANHYLVTSSDDKTVRVWKLQTGKLMRTIRPPIGVGDEGRLNAVAISPDGRIIATAGWTGFEWDNTGSIYLFDRKSGKLIHRISGLPNVILHLVYSRDGRHLIATLFGKNGIRSYDTVNYAQVGEDRDYGDHSYNADFDSADRLVTTSYDGFIRLYEIAGNGSLHLLNRVDPATGEQPYSVSFSPDNTRVAVSFRSSSKVAVLSGRDLSLLSSPDVTGVNKGSFYSVAWSADGHTLFAGGSYRLNNIQLIRAWTDGGRGRYRDIPATANTIIHMLALRDGGMVFGSGEPSFGVINANGKRKLFIGPATADFRNNQSGFLLSTDGSVVQFSYEYGGRSPARFAIAKRRLEMVSTQGTSLRAPIIEAAGLAITGWRNTTSPKLNGKPLQLDQHEISRSVAIAPNGQQFLIGTDWALRCFERDGTQRWGIAIPSAAWAINITADDKLAVVAYGDGIIRWYRLSDGKEMLAFFPHADRKRWVLWTPSSYYDGSPGTENLIGWRINNGRDGSADFLPVKRFSSTYYRPDLMMKILKTCSEQEALRLANEESGHRRQ